MPRIEVPTSVTLFVQWSLHPFPTPHVAEQKLANTKCAVNKTKELLIANSVLVADVIVTTHINGAIRLEILKPLESEDGREYWETILTVLKGSKDIESISIYVNNDTSEKIATNLADKVNRPWHQGYQGYNTTTLIYHK